MTDIKTVDENRHEVTEAGGMSSTLLKREAYIESLDRQIQFVWDNNPGRQKVVREIIASLTGIREGLVNHEDKQAMEHAEDLHRTVMRMAGVVSAEAMGPDGRTQTYIYGSNESRENHHYALSVLATVRQMTGLEDEE